jgi:hypothetical protein
MGDDDLQIYSNLGLQVKSTFTREDFLNNPETRNTLERDFYERMMARIEREVTVFYDDLRAHEVDVASGMLAYDRGLSVLLSIIVENIKKDYKFELFYERPELAIPLLIEYEIVN